MQSMAPNARKVLAFYLRIENIIHDLCVFWKFYAMDEPLDKLDLRLL